MRGLGGRLLIACGVMALAFLPVSANAVHHLIVIDEVLASWQGDNEIQFIELRLAAPGQGQIVGAEIEILDRDGGAVARLVFTTAVLNDLEGASILIASPKLQNLAGLTPDFGMPAGIIPRQGGRICYRAPSGVPGETIRVDCVAYGKFAGDNEAFGNPTPVTPDNRSLQRLRDESPPDNAADWVGVLSPTPKNNFNDRTVLETTCLDGRIDPGEECDGEDFGGVTCADQGFVGGTLRCAQCKLDTSECTDCGDEVIDSGEECDGTNLNGETCAHLGFTRGALACSADCVFDTDGCQELQIPGRGPKGKTCFLEWNILNPDSPVRNGRPQINQKCVDNDPACDFDGGTPNSCTFRVHLCFNRDDGRVKTCRPRGISAFEVLRPSASSEDPVERANRLALTNAAIGLSGGASEDGRRVIFDPALQTIDICSEAADVLVPVKERPGKRPRKGKRLIKSVATEALGHRRDRDKIKLFCRPNR